MLKIVIKDKHNPAMLCIQIIKPESTLRTAEAKYNSSFLILPMPSALPIVPPSVLKSDNAHKTKEKNVVN